MTRPKILITNDDGIFAPGIRALWEAMSEIGDPVVVAPHSEQSAVGHAITLTDPLRGSRPDTYSQTHAHRPEHEVDRPRPGTDPSTLRATRLHPRSDPSHLPNT